MAKLIGLLLEMYTCFYLVSFSFFIVQKSEEALVKNPKRPNREQNVNRCFLVGAFVDYTYSSSGFLKDQGTDTLL